MDIRKILAKALLENEISGNLAFVYKFSDADGVRTGKSGYSFGRCQFDLQNNPMARQCLTDAGFTLEEVVGLTKQELGAETMRALNARLQTPAVMAIIDDYDNRHLDETITHTHAVVTNAGLHLADQEVFIHLADYHNQFYINYRGKCVAWLQRLGRPISSADVLDYKLTTLWGQKRPDDVARRWNNIHAICAGR